MRIVAAFAVVITAIGLALFWVQNSARVTQLSFDVGFAAWQLQNPVPLPTLLAVCFGGGFLCGALTTTLLSRRRRVTEAPPDSSSPGTSPGAW